MPWASLIYKHRIALFYLCGFFGIAALIFGLFVNFPLLGLAPLAIVVLLVALYDYKLLFYALLFVLPISDEYEIVSGVRLYLPTEPIVLLLLALMIPLAINKHKVFKGAFWKHPLTVILIVNLIWIGFTSITSTYPIYSLKYLLAKVWFVGIYYFLASHIIKSKLQFKRWFWLLIIPSIAGIIYVMIKHGATGFLFDEINPSVRPIFRNHVNYGVWIAAILPLLFLGRTWYKRDTLLRLFFNIAILLTIAAVYFSYTRGAWVALVALPIFYLIIHFKFVNTVLTASLIGVLAFGIFLFSKNTYLKYAPNYETTIYHEDFSDHITATFQMEDMSTVERFYRWIAAIKMFQEKPILGFGPGSFVSNYKTYTVTSYETYISDNEERSSVHNYFLTMLTDQGIPGLLIFISMLYIILGYFQRVYHRIKNQTDKNIIIGVMGCFFVLLVNNVFSDLLEADKLGPMFFMCMAILVNYDLKLSESATKTYRSID